MADIREIKGLGSGRARVKLALNLNLTSVQLTTQEGFVLSRIDGNCTLETLCLISGLGAEATGKILQRLLSLGLITIEEEGTANRKTQPTPPTTTVKQSVSRGGSERTDSSPRISHSITGEAYSEPRVKVPSGTETPVRTNREEGGTGKASSSAAPSLETNAKPLEFPDDEPGIELKPETRAAIRNLHSKLGELNFFQLLDIDLDADTTSLRRAYFKRSKEFHPDRFFSKQLGVYKEMLQEVFKQISAAFKFLEDEEKRRAYRQMILQEMEQASLVRQIEEQGEAALREVEREREQSHRHRPVVPTIIAEPKVEKITSEQAVIQVPSSKSVSHTVEPLSAPKAAIRTRKDTDSFTNVAALSEAERKEREKRRDEDHQRRRKMITSSVVSHFQRARKFYEQGITQLAANQVLAAAASLKLAVTFHPEEPSYQQAYEEALNKSQSVTAENHFKRAVFEESVGRIESAGKFYANAADLIPKVEYLLKAAEFSMHAEDLIKAQEYATKAVQSDPNSADARVLLARAYAAAGLMKNARRELQLAHKMDPGNSSAKELLKVIKGL